MTDWSRFPVEAMGWPTLLKRTLIHVELLQAVLRRAHRGGVLEVGVGSGAQGAVVSWATSPVIGVERDGRILWTARLNQRRFGRDVKSVRGDARALPFASGTFAVAMSQGLMEHADDDGIAALLREQLRVCRSVVFSVPSDHYPRQDIGDERLMGPRSWLRVVERAVDGRRYRVRARYYRFDSEGWMYSAWAGRRLGAFSVLVTVDPC